MKPQQPAANTVKLPYFDYLLSMLSAGNDTIEKSFGRHVHWGYWQHPKTATLTTEDFQQAAENLTRQVCLAAQIKDGQQVLDVGCGFGGTVAFINEQYHAMQLVGLNLDERQLERARATVFPLADNSIAFQHGNACALPFADNSFDVVLAVECIFHFPSREQFFKEAYRVLKPNGYLALSDFIPSTSLLPFTKMSWFGRFYGNCNLDYSSQHYRQLAQQIGFNTLVEHDITANTLPTYDYLQQLANQQGIKHKTARLETAVVAILSRLKLLHYYIYGWQKSA
ncbi:MAG: methyltransferase domain-containing protein [Methylococcaceae bacterium]